MNAQQEKRRGFRKEKRGTVVSSKMEKTVLVKVDRNLRHPIYEKEMTRSKKYFVHDELECREGDQVRIMETRPLSKNKRWRVVQKLS